MDVLGNDLCERIKRYQKYIEKFAAKRDDVKLQEFLGKLQRLPIKMCHLEKTGVGRTVNGLRKFEGKAGEIARCIVRDWKEMVINQTPVEEEEEDDEEDDGYGEETRKDSDDSDADGFVNSRVPQCKEDVEMDDKHLKSHPREEVKDLPAKTDKSSHRNSSSHHSRSTHEHKKHSSSHHKSESSSRHADNNNSKHKHHNSSSSNKHKSHKKESSSSSDSDDHHSHKRKREHVPEAEPNKQKLKKDESHSRHEKDAKKVKSSEDDRSSSKKRHDSPIEAEKSKSKHDDKHKSKKSSDKHQKDKKEEKKDDLNKKKDRKSDGKSSNGGTSTINSDKSKKVGSKAVVSINGIDSGSGASFAEALGMCEPSSSKPSTSSKDKKEKSKKPLLEKPVKENKEKSSSKAENALPKLLKEPDLEPIDLNLSSLLPTITPNYRPLGNLPTAELIAKKTMSDYEALSTIISSKSQRTKVYSGNKSAFSSVPSLFEMCIRILQDNIDSLEYTGGVPYHILKPIMDKATPQQLFTLEHHNPYLIADTNELWKLHCEKDFRNKKRQELESWREMYMRCLDEREAKLIALTANIKQAQDKSVPVRQTMLAYVDDIAKPPRNIARKQAKNGTGRHFDKKPLVTPSSRLSSLATSGDAGKVAVPNPGARAAERSERHSAVKPKKAPLMAKSLSLLKNRFRR